MHKILQQLLVGHAMTGGHLGVTRWETILLLILQFYLHLACQNIAKEFENNFSVHPPHVANPVTSKCPSTSLRASKTLYYLRVALLHIETIRKPIETIKLIVKSSALNNWIYKKNVP